MLCGLVPHVPLGPALGPSRRMPTARPVDSSNSGPPLSPGALHRRSTRTSTVPGPRAVPHRVPGIQSAGAPDDPPHTGLVFPVAVPVAHSTLPLIADRAMGPVIHTVWKLHAYPGL